MKIADYYVLAKRLNSNRTHIDYLYCHTVNSDGGFYSESGESKSRQSIVSDIRTYGTVYKTIFRGSSGDWEMGSQIRVTRNGYLRTDSNDTDADNLSELPEY